MTPPVRADPPVRVDCGAVVTDLTLRILALVLALLLGAPLWLVTPWALVPAAIFALAAYYAVTPLTFLMFALLGVSYLIAVPADSPLLLVYIAGLHTLFLLLALLEQLPHGSVISRGALLRMGQRNVPLQLMSQALAVIALLVSGAGSSLTVVIAGGLALCGLAVWLAYSFRRG